ncbi:MAG TPA: UDP-N-acetylmuramoyl-L-alanyl-D-glutamate--2,6-diaminopimelate ligase, partial [Candidatus Krumholzibacteria bacterium]|nr:UDP-N-acetylmuramoyl-L-alanyl-D-glutamate--2,6-diaminopimelate ligase [Candidatus Krumholzibacteria bacterium]
RRIDTRRRCRGRGDGVAESAMKAMEESMETGAVALGSLIDALKGVVSDAPDAAARALSITGVTADSRKAAPGFLFVAVKGTSVDGHHFMADAAARGAVAVIAEQTPAQSSIPVITVTDSSKALALVASRFYGDPAHDLFLCGVTGTNGKTSTTYLVRSIMARTGRRMGIIGTLGHGIDTLVKDPHTTPDAVTLHSWFRAMRDQHCFGVVMEVSSHAVRQHRVWGLDFNVGILTNVTHDHLDFHKTMDDYIAAKSEFCHSLVAPGRRKANGTLVYWMDDANARNIGAAFGGAKIRVGSGSDADWRLCDVDVSLAGTRFALALPGGETLRVNMKLLGGFVPANASVAAAAAFVSGATLEQIRDGLEAVARVPGRFEALGGGGKPVVIVDYAHTPDGFERVLATCRALRPRRLVTVFGCGGDRDASKRPVMGAIAARESDRVYLTTDNPRSEKVEDIINDIRAGIPRQSDVVVELDRADAIHAAVAESRSGDLVALLGKGHEDYQLIGTRKLPFSDREQAEEALASWPAA